MGKREEAALGMSSGVGDPVRQADGLWLDGLVMKSRDVHRDLVGFCSGGAFEEGFMASVCWDEVGEYLTNTLVMLWVAH